MSPTPTTNLAERYARTHVSFGWWALLLFLVLGFTLELLHGFKARLYLDVANETRRLMWTLAHAHGALLSLVHVVFGLSLRSYPEMAGAGIRIVSRCLVAGSVLLPAGFFLGGVSFYSGDPGVGIGLAPVGAAALLVAVYLTARTTGRIPRSGGGGRKHGGKSRDG